MADPPSHKPPADLAYATPPETPGHVDDLLRLNTGCLLLSLVWMGTPLVTVALVALWDGGAAWGPAARESARLLAVPAVLFGVWVSRGTIRRWAAERAAVERGDLLRPGEVVVAGRVLAKDPPLGADSLMRVSFTLDGVDVTGRRKVSDATWHRSRVGGAVEVAVDPRRRRRWRVLPPPAAVPHMDAAAGGP